MFPSPFGHAEVLPYSPVLNDVADRIAEKLRPYVALHWRMEAVGISSPDFTHCADHALDKLAGMKDLKHVWFMTDFRAPIARFATDLCSAGRLRDTAQRDFRPRLAQIRLVPQTGDGRHRALARRFPE